MVSEEPISNEPPIQVTTMSSSSEQNPNFNLNIQPPSTADKPLIALNITAQINEKLTPSTFPQWRAQFEALLSGYDLLDYVEGTLQCPSSAGIAADELCKTHWVRQDKLILSAILASTSPSITPLIATEKTSHEAWKKLQTLYASRSRTCAMQLKEELTLIQRPDFWETAAPIRARESSLAFEELHDLLVGHEAYLRRLEAATQHLVVSANYTKTKQSVQGGSHPWSSKQHGNQRGTQGSSPGRNSNGAQRDGCCYNNNASRPNNYNRRYQPKCQICDQLGHIAKSCPQFHSQNVSINCATTSTGKDKNCPSKFMPSVTNQKVQNTQEPLPLFFDAQESVVSSSTLSGTPKPIAASGRSQHHPSESSFKLSITTS
ncbi:hypothetical protein Acr_00g0047070 [Actinidia rufa]|uniref:CCHC-type domain-containing protein n=1 Tax=Actinidia rufa TaxID=165716 RepID=A0A7J0DJV2_9ERIC|nr:hypothetical protein Acr_00g0047070 [Actinidia rufa]